jgi:hypothetical protein
LEVGRFRYTQDGPDGQRSKKGKEKRMSNLAFMESVLLKLKAAQSTVSDDGEVTLSVDALAEIFSRHNIEVIDQFVRLQRAAGIQTVHYLAVNEPDSFTWLVERMVDFDLLLEKDKNKLKIRLQEQVVDIRPVVDERLLSLCNKHYSLSDFDIPNLTNEKERT